MLKYASGQEVVREGGDLLWRQLTLVSCSSRHSGVNTSFISKQWAGRGTNHLCLVECRRVCLGDEMIEPSGAAFQSSLTPSPSTSSLVDLK